MTIHLDLAADRRRERLARAGRTLSNVIVGFALALLVLHVAPQQLAYLWGICQ